MTNDRAAARTVECWFVKEKGFYLRLPGERRAGKPFATFDEVAKAAIDAKVPLPFAFTFRDAVTVPKEHFPITRSS